MWSVPALGREHSRYVEDLRTPRVRGFRITSLRRCGWADLALYLFQNLWRGSSTVSHHYNAVDTSVKPVVNRWVIAL